MLRGGSWNNNQDNARCDSRNDNNPNNSNNNNGFRVVSHIFLPYNQTSEIFKNLRGLRDIAGNATGLLERVRGRGCPNLTIWHRKWRGLSVSRS